MSVSNGYVKSATNRDRLKHRNVARFRRLWLETLEQRTLLAVAPVVTDGLVSWWHADGDATDAIGGHSGTLQNGALANAVGQFGQAFSLDGSDDFVTIPDSASLYPQIGSFTVMAWIRTTATGGTIISHYECGGSCDGSAYYSLSINASGKLNGGIGDDLNHNQTLTSNSVVNDDKFHQVALMRDLQSTPPAMRLYVDGSAEVVARLTATGPLEDGYQDADPITIGASYVGGQNAQTSFFKGLVDEVEYYGRALTSSEMQTLAGQSHLPTAKSSGPYSVIAGGGVQLDASPSVDPDQSSDSLLYTWDFDGDGLYGETGAAAIQGDETGSHPTFLSTGITAPTFAYVGLHVTDNSGNASSDVAQIEISKPPITWDGGGDGKSWADKLNWSGDQLPASTDDVVIATGPNVTIQLPALPAANQTIRKLTSNSKIAMSGGSLAVTQSATVTASMTVSNGSLKLGFTDSFTDLSLTNGGRINAISGQQLVLTVSGSLSVDTTSSVDVSSQGFPGAFDGNGGPGHGNRHSSFSNNSGAGYGGQGGISADPWEGGASYGSVKAPFDLGSGGSDGGTGGTGGGAVKLVVAGALQLDGTIKANGGDGGLACCFGGAYYGGAGSGGSVWIVASSIFGAGSISANGGSASGNGGGGGGGRIAVYSQANSLSGNVTARGGAGYQSGGSGTVYYSTGTPTQERVVVDNAGATGAPATSLGELPSINGQLFVTGNAIATISGPLSVSGDIVLTAAGKIVTASLQPLLLTVGGKVSIDATSSIDVTGDGFPGAFDSRGGPGHGNRHSSFSNNSGAGYGGQGGISSDPWEGGITYGSTTQPTDLGSGGSDGGAGGGALKLTVNGAVELNGAIRANGADGTTACCFGGAYYSGGGSGGSLWIVAPSITGKGSITANGGNAPGSGDRGAGGGGGGRVAIDSDISDFTGVITAYGGQGFQVGGAGTVYFPPGAGHQERIVVDNGGASGSPPSGLDGMATINGQLFVRGGAVASNSTPLAITGDAQVLAGAVLDLNSSLAISGSGRLAIDPSVTMTASGNVTGDTTNANSNLLVGTVRLDGSGTAAAPQLLEVMSRDLGNAAAGYSHNFAYGTLALANKTYVKLIDQNNNSPGAEPEALYVGTLIVPSGTTLNLNGLHVFARASQIGGTVTGGTVTTVADSGPLPLNWPLPGTISAPGEADDWTFFGRAGAGVTILLNPGTSGSFAALSPSLNFARVEVVDPTGNVIGSIDSTTSGASISISGVKLLQEGVYHVRVSAISPGTTGNYVVGLYDATVDIQPLTLNQIYTGTIETVYSVDRWTFSAVAGQQVRFDWINSTSNSIHYQLTGSNGYTAFSGITGDSDLFTLPTTGDYVLSADALGAEPGTYTFRLLQTTQTPLVLGTSLSGVLPGSGSAQIFKLTMPDREKFLLTFDDANNADNNEVYVKFGSPPTRNDFQYKFSSPAAADQQILVTSGLAGDWYVLVYGESVPAASTFTLLAAGSNLIVTSATPNQGAVNADLTLTISGAGFEPGTTAQLRASDGKLYSPTSAQIDLSTQITASFSSGTVPAGTYSIVLQRSGTLSSTLPDSLTVADSGAPKLVTHLILPGQLGRHATATIYVEYANTGNVAMPAPLLTLESADKDNSDRPFLTLDQSRVVQGFWTSALPSGFSHSVQFLASGATPGVLQPGESMRVPIYYAGLQQPWDFSDSKVEFRVRPTYVTDTRPVNWSSLKASLQPPGINATAWDRVFANVIAQTGSTWGDYVRMLDDNAVYLGRLGEHVVDVSQLWQFAVRQANDLSPLGNLASSLDAGIATIGPGLSWGRSFAPTISGRFVRGPFGFGWSAPWQASLNVASDGTVTVLTATGYGRRFQPDGRSPGSYFSQQGDHGVMTKSGGTYLLREPDGSLTHFFGGNPTTGIGKLDYYEDTNGNRITAGYTNGVLKSLTSSGGQSLTIAYKNLGTAAVISSVTDSVGRQVIYSYDETNLLLTSVKGYDGLVTTYTYDTTSSASATRNALLSVGYANETHIYYGYDAEGRLVSVSGDPGAPRIDFSYVGAGQIAVSDGRGTADLYFNEQGFIEKMQDALDRPILFSYDGSLNVTQATDGTGNIVVITHDTNGSPLTVTDLLGNVTTFTYNSLHRLRSVTDARGNSITYAYDASSNLTSTTYADSSSEVATYYPEGNLLTTTDRNGNLISYQHNASGQLTRETFSDGSHYDFGYDSHGNLATTVDTTGTTTYDYDGADRLSKVTYPSGHSLAYKYDAAGRRTQMKDETGFEANYEYDSLGRLKRLFDASGATGVTYSYDAQGRVAGKVNGNATYTTYDYDDAGQLLHLVNFAPNGSINSRFDYTYDNLGRRITERTSDGQWTYSYDPTGQLIHAAFVSTNPTVTNQDLSYVYDAAGNRIQTSANGALSVYLTNSLNEYSTVGGTTYTYDKAGNLNSKRDASGITTYSYNALGQLVGVSSPSGYWAFTYDALGNRMSNIHNGQQTEYVYDPTGLSNMVAQYSGQTNPEIRFNYGLGLTDRVSSSGDVAYYDADAIGSTSGLTNALGAYVNQYLYLPFGVSQSTHETISNPFEYNGQLGVMNDDDGLQFMRSRYYAADLGRFTATDRIGIAAGDLNLYRYTANNPVSRVDPLGTDWFSDHPVGTALGLAAGAIVAGFAITGATVVGLGIGAVAIGAEFGLGAGITGTVIGGGLGLWELYEILDRQGLAPGIFPPIENAVDDLLDLGDELGDAIGNEVADLLWGPPGGGGLANPPGGDGAGGDGGTGGGSIGGPGGPGGPPGGGGGDDGGGGDGDGAPFPPPCEGCGGGDGGGDGGDSGTSGPIDPNQKIGSAGFGTPSFVRGDGSLSYRIEFENDPTATAPAQQVDITDQLDANVDLNSLEFVEIGFGNTLVSVPGHSQHFQTTVPMTYNGQSFNVEIELGVHTDTRQVYARFLSVDPNTDLPPDVLTGFLPPEPAHLGDPAADLAVSGRGRGLGHVSYAIKPKANLPSGTEIRNTALITFDLGESIATNQVSPHDPTLGTDPTKEALVTIDSAPPTSNVQALTPLENDRFKVRWLGADDAGGSGLSSINIFVSDNAGPYSLWTSATTAGFAEFANATPGHTYSFYAIATDNVGHLEVAPIMTDAQTVISANSWQNAESPLDVDQDGSVVATDVITIINYINARGSGRLIGHRPLGTAFVDPTGDQNCVAEDVLKVINYINALPGARGEGESASSTAESEGSLPIEVLPDAVLQSPASEPKVTSSSSTLIAFSPQAVDAYYEFVTDSDQRKSEQSFSNIGFTKKLRSEQAEPTPKLKLRRGRLHDTPVRHSQQSTADPLPQ